MSLNVYYRPLSTSLPTVLEVLTPCHYIGPGCISLLADLHVPALFMLHISPGSTSLLTDLERPPAYY